MLGKIKGRRRGGGRGWDGWMASQTQWTWVWENSRRWWRTGEPGVLQSIGLQRVKHDLLNNNICFLRYLSLHLSSHLFGMHFKVNYKYHYLYQSLSHAWLFATPGTIAGQAPLSMGFYRQQYRSGLPFPSPGKYHSFKYFPLNTAAYMYS